MINPLSFLHMYNAKNGLNSYLIVNKDGHALLIDPFTFERELFCFINQLNITIKGVLLTALTESTIGLTTFNKIYDAPIYGPTGNSASQVFTMTEQEKSQLKDDFDISILPIYRDKRSDLMPIKAGSYIFTGSILVHRLAQSLPERAIRFSFLESLEKNFSPNGESIYLFSSFGPPTTLAAEKQINFQLPHITNSMPMTSSYNNSLSYN